MNILIINHYAGSPILGMEYRPYYFGQELIKQGHKVFIIAANNAHVRTKQIETSQAINEQIIDGITYYWIKTPAYSGNGVKRILNMLCFVRKLKRYSGFFAKQIKPDAVIASSTYPMDNYAAKKIADKSGAKYGYEVHDLWPLSPMELGGYSPKHPFIKYLQKAENFAYKHSDFVISLLPKTLPHMQSHGLASQKWNYIPNGICISDWENKKAIPDTLKANLNEIKSKFNFCIGYTGGHGISNALDYFVDAAKQIPDTAFVLIGKGPEKEKLIQSASESKNIFFFDSVEKLQIPDLLSYFDALYMGLQKIPLYRFGISLNKLFDYMMAEKPIIQAIDAGNDIVQEANCGFSAEAENVDSIVETIIKMKNSSPEERLLMSKNGKSFVLENHDYKVLAKKFISSIS